jgi:hypothetical protein
MFEYTRRDFWGGPSIPYWVLAVFTVLFGFIGLDHILLRSPASAFMKFIANIFTLGLWYFYDIVQIIGDKEKVMNYGLTAPLYGPLGIGAGMFTDNQPDAEKSKSPWRFLLYSMMVFVPFGFDALIGGDRPGAFMKFICTIIPIFWPILFIWMLYSIGRLYVFPKPLFTEGIDRPFPVNFFMDKKGFSELGPKTVPDPASIGCDTYDGGFLGYLPPFVRTALTFMFPGLIPAVDAGLMAVKTGSNAATASLGTVKLAAETAGKTLEGAKKVINAATNAAASAVSVIPTVVAKGPDMASAVTGSLLKKYTDPSEIIKQVGGGVLEENTPLSNTVLLAGFGIILMGGVYYGLKRLNNSATSLFRKDEGRLTESDKGRKRDDSPPKPY